VLGFPANDFGAQEPGSDDEIAQFCSTNFGVKFPMFSKIVVNGEERHPLYAELIKAQPRAVEVDDGFREKLERYGLAPKNPGDVFWNFEKFLVARDGSVAGRFSPSIAPDSAEIIAAIESELAK